MIKQFDNAEALFNQAVQHFHNGAYAECERLCLEVVRQNPTEANPNHVLALACRAQGKLEDAEVYATRASSQDRANPSILNSLGLIFLDQGKHDRAAKLFQKALKLNPSNTPALTNHGHALVKLNRLSDAEECYRKALSITADSADALIHLSLLLRKQKRSDELKDLISRFPSTTPEHPGLTMVRGLGALDLNKALEAEIEFRRALKSIPRSAELWGNLGLALAQQGKTEQAEEAYLTAIELDPHLSELRLNFADLLKYQSPSVARTHLAQAEQIAPGDKMIQDMLGFTWFLDGEFDAALECFNRSLDIDPSFERAAYHRAGVYFLKGDLESAWKDYNRKYGPNGISGSPVGNKIPLWNRSESPKAPLLVWTDQGLGDEILQLGFISELYREDIPLIIATSGRLSPIVARSFPKAQCFDSDLIGTKDSILNTLSAQIPAMQIAGVYWKATSDPPSRDSYLAANNTQVNELRNKYLQAGGQGPLVGISWRSASVEFGEQKSIRLVDMMPLLEQPGVTFVNLQYGDTSADIAELPSGIQKKIICDPDIDPLIDMDAFAAQTRAVDLVVTTSNTTAHLAGALGCKTWTLVPRVGPGWLWYWFDERVDSPWYPSMRLIRQSHQGDWSSAIASLSAKFSRFIMKFQSLTGN